MNCSDQQHWQQVYTGKAADEVSWFQATPVASLEALERLGASSDHSLIDVGGGASSLVDELLDRGWSDLAVLDISASALDKSRQRLGDRSGRVEWIVSDITRWSPGRTYDIWHDRAVFHFLTDAGDRAAYREALKAALGPDGAVIMATFALDGPERCSGLEVRRYDPEGMAAELGPGFELVEHWTERHVTPAGKGQAFTWCILKRKRPA